MQQNDVPPEIWDAYIAAIRKSELEKFEQVILEATAPAIELGCVPSNGNPSKFLTKAGGFPDLPADVAWPEHNGGLLPFIAQIDLSELPQLSAYPLPRTGFLYFFHWFTNETMDRPYRVIYSLAQASEVSQRQVNEQRILPNWQGVRLYEEEKTGSIEIIPTLSDTLAANLAVKSGLLQEGWEYEGNLPFYNLSTVFFWSDYRESLTGKEEREFIGNWGQLFGYNSEHFLISDFEPFDGGFLYNGSKQINLLEVISINNMQWSDVGYLDFFIRPEQLAKQDFSDLTVLVATS